RCGLMKPLAVITIVLCLLLGCSTRQGTVEQDILRSGNWIDLSHDLADDTIYWPTAEPFQLNTVAAGKTDAGSYDSPYQLCASEHGGTHIDAPVHFAEGRNSVDQISLDRLIGPAIKVDISAKANSDRDYLIS